MTIHSSKGLEFDIIFLPGWKDYFFIKNHEEKGRKFEEEQINYPLELKQEKL